MTQNASGKARPQKFRLRLSDAAAPGSIPLELSARPLWPFGLAFAGMFAIFAGVEWAVILKMSRHSVANLFDLMFLLFQGFWVLGWSVGVVILGAFAVLLCFYGESARLQADQLVTNFIGRREYTATTMAALMTAPYNRIIVMQLTLIFGGWIILLLKSPIPALAVLVLVKTALDFSAHRTEHTRLGRAA